MWLTFSGAPMVPKEEFLRHYKRVVADYVSTLPESCFVVPQKESRWSPRELLLSNLMNTGIDYWHAFEKDTETVYNLLAAFGEETALNSQPTHVLEVTDKRKRLFKKGEVVQPQWAEEIASAAENLAGRVYTEMHAKRYHLSVISDRLNRDGRYAG